MRILFIFSTLLVFSCKNPSDGANVKNKTALDADGANNSFAETKWRLFTATESENNRLDQFDKGIISDMKKDLSKYSMTFVNSSTMVFGNDQDTSAYSIVNDTLLSKDKKDKIDTFLIRSSSTSTLHLHFIKGLDLHFTKAS